MNKRIRIRLIGCFSCILNMNSRSLGAETAGSFKITFNASSAFAAFARTSILANAPCSCAAN